MKPHVLRWFLLSFGVVAGLSLLVLPTPDDRAEVYVTTVVPPASFVYFLLLIVPGVAVVASITSALIGRGQVGPWLAAYAGVVAGTVPWLVWGGLTGALGLIRNPGDLLWAVVAIGGLPAGIPYLVGLPFLITRRWLIRRRGCGAGSEAAAIPPDAQRAAAEEPLADGAPHSA